MLGIADIQADGHAEVTRNPDTVIYLTKDLEGYWATVLKDRGNDIPAETIRFQVGSFWEDFSKMCRPAPGERARPVVSRERFTRFLQDTGLSFSTVFEVLGVKNAAEITDFAEAMEKIKTHLKGGEEKA